MAGHKGSPYYDIFLRYEMWLESIDRKPVLNAEGFALLVGIDETSSLSTTAKKLDMSYRKAWGILRDVEAYLGFRLVEKSRGGATGGHTILTYEGRQLIRAYNGLIHETDIAMKSIAKVFFNRINDINNSK